MHFSYLFRGHIKQHQKEILCPLRKNRLLLCSYQLGFLNHLSRKLQKLQVCMYWIYNIYEGQTSPVQARTGPEGSVRLRLPNFKPIGT